MARQLFIDSRDRVTGTTTNFTIQLNQTLVTTAATQYRVDNMRVPMVIPRIQAGVNDTLWFTLGDDPTPTFVVLTEGTYSGTDMAAMINQVLHDKHPEGPNPESTDVQSVWKVSYNNHTASLTIGNLVDSKFHIFNDADAKTWRPATLPTFASDLFQNTVTTAKTTQPGVLGGGIAWTFSYCSMVANDLIYLSSVIPPESRVRSEPVPANIGAWGDRLYCVMAQQRTSIIGHEAWAGIAWVQELSTGRGLFAEAMGASKPEVELQLERTLEDMVARRPDRMWEEPKIAVAGTTCSRSPVCALAVATYSAEGWS